jgi:hypothetical protein
MMLAGAPVRCAVAGGAAVYGRVLPEACASGVLPIRLTADCARGRKGERTYVLAKNAALYQRGLHASGVRGWGPRWLQILLRGLVKAG